MEIFGVVRKQMRAVDGKQEIYLEWPNMKVNSYIAIAITTNPQLIVKWTLGCSQ